MLFTIAPLVLSALLSTVGLPSLGAEPLIQVEIDDTDAEVTITAAGAIELDLTLDFEQVIGLSASSLGLSAELVALNDLGLLGRLPQDVSIPALFPLMVQIEPPSTSPLTFTGVVEIEFHTHNLVYTEAAPFRLFAAPLGGPFVDITKSVGMGSYRARGVKGGFSQFLLAADVRSGPAVIDDKFDRLDSLLSTHAGSMSVATHTSLIDLLDAAAASWYNAGDAAEAARLIDDLADEVRAASGSEIPNTWRSSRDLTNVAGLLRAAAETLRFSLLRQSSHPAG